MLVSSPHPTHPIRAIKLHSGTQPGHRTKFQTVLVAAMISITKSIGIATKLIDTDLIADRCQHCKLSPLQFQLMHHNFPGSSHLVHIPVCPSRETI